MALRPDRLVLVCGTGTDVGKTWVGARLLDALRGQGITVAARKPAQSFDVDLMGNHLGATDAEVLGAASGEDSDTVCPPTRSYRRAMAPPMAAEALGMAPFSIADIVEELAWPARPVAVGLVEMAGGVRSPQASDGDTTHVVAALHPEVILLVGDAGLGTINAVRQSMDALATVTDRLAGVRTAVVLDRFDDRHDIHRRNRDWLAERDGYGVFTVPGEERLLADLVLDEEPVEGQGRPA